MRHGTSKGKQTSCNMLGCWNWRCVAAMSEERVEGFVRAWLAASTCGAALRTAAAFEWGSTTHRSTEAAAFEWGIRLPFPWSSWQSLGSYPPCHHSP